MARNENHEKLLSILQEHAPNGNAQQKCANFYNEMVRDNLSDKDIELRLVMALHDGLAYGNWIWVVSY